MTAPDAPAAAGPAGGGATPAREPLLRVRGAAKRFGALVVIDDLDLTLGPDEALGIVGPNGAGKSTLLALVAGDLTADRGTVEFEGADVTRRSAAYRVGAGIGRTFQVPRPFVGMTVFENVLVGATYGQGLRRAAAYRAGVDALEVAGLADKANTVTGTLPLLDRKRLELARALATRPRLLLLDEVAGGLTEPEVLALVETVRSLRERGVAVIWIEHIVHALTRVVDRLMCLTYGRVLAEGLPADVLASKEVQEVYLGSTLEVTP